MINFYFLNPDKSYRPCDVHEWSNQIKELHKHVMENKINDCLISTVWIGLDHGFVRGRPLLLETMVFDKKGNHIYRDKYSTWEEAIEGHKKAIEWVKAW